MMVRSALIAFSLGFATLIAGSVTKLSWSKVGEQREVVAVQPKKPTVVKARVVYEGYGNEVASKLDIVPAPAVNPSVGAKPIDASVGQTSAVAPASSNAAIGALDLNVAAARELNAIGGGMIGRAIIKGRPYRSVDELLTKRVINRTTFDLIKSQVSIRS